MAAEHKRARCDLELELEQKDTKLAAARQKIVELAEEAVTAFVTGIEQCEAERDSAIAELERRHAAELEQLDAAIARSMAEAERLRARCSRGYTAGLVAEVTENARQISKLSERRANNMGATRRLNLELRRVEVLNEENERLRAAITANWGADTLELAGQGLLVPRLEAEIETLSDALGDAEAECTRLARVVYPAPPIEKARGAPFDMPMRFTVMKLIAKANICHTRVPVTIDILADYFGIHIPGRLRKVVVEIAKGVRKYETKWLKFVPSENTCESIRSEMGPLAQLEVGEEIIKAGGSAGNFALHTDAASSEGRELSAFVVSHRPAVNNGEPSRIRNLLLDLTWAMDKTAATRAGDFRHVCKSVAALCANAEMANAALIENLKPSATMTDRANAEIAATRLITGSDAPNPTCGEHGAIVNPLGAGTKAMDKVVRGWMGKSDEAAALEDHKVRALHMAVGWNSSPSGALIYCTCKLGASFSDKGYSNGQDARGFNEYTANLNPDDRESILALGHMEDLLSIKGSRMYVGPLNAPVIDRILTDGPGSYYSFLKQKEELAKPGGGKIRKQIIAGAESPEIRACVRAEAIIGDFYMWPLLRALKYRPVDGSDPHVLDMAPIYQEAYERLTYARDKPRLVR